MSWIRVDNPVDNGKRRLRKIQRKDYNMIVGYRKRLKNQTVADKKEEIPMKKMISLLVALTCLLTAVAGFAQADGGSWYCETCGATRTTDFCPDCGARRPAESTAGGWPVWTKNGTGTSLRAFNNESQRHQAYYGPNGNYPGAGGYKPYKVVSATALFREGDYVLVDLDYKTVGRRCLYFKYSAITSAAADQVSLIAYPAVTTSTVQPKFGPGYEYDSVVKKNQSNGSTMQENVVIGSGTQLSVFFEMNGWVFAEFGSILGTIRAWLPANTVQ